jgi:hypothetical protein
MGQKSRVARFLPPAIAVLVMAFVVRFFVAPVETLKLLGAPFLLLPTVLGVLPAVDADDVHLVVLNTRSPVIQIDAPGRFAMYASDDAMLARANSLADSDVTWLKLKEVGAVEPVASTVIKRGALIYDPVAVPGRPVMSFTVTKHGRYELVFVRQSGEMHFAPDLVTGRDATILAWIAGQVFVLVGVLFIWALPRLRASRAQARLAAEEASRKRAEAEEFVRRFGGKE